MRIPQPRHQIIKPIGKDLYLATDQRSSSTSRFNGSSGGGGYQYFLHKEQRSSIQKECDKLRRKCAQRNIRSSRWDNKS